MTSPDDRDGARPIDPDFAALFRPDDESMPGGSVSSVSAADPAAVAAPAEAPAAEAGQSPTGGAVGDPVPAPDGPAVDTGRLFRSQGVSDHPEAVLALSSDHFGRLRTLRRDTDQSKAESKPASVPAATSDEEAAHAMAAAPIASSEVGGHDVGPVDLEDAAGSGQLAMSGRRGRHRGRAIGAGAVYLIVIGVTVIVGFANALLADGTIGWPTGVALVISSVYAALTVRREDDVVAFLTPPVAFFLAALTAGQVFVDSLEGSLLDRGVILFFTLAENWVWIIGATLAALVIVLVRRRRS